MADNPSDQRGEPIWGASFSLHRCTEFGLDKQAVLQAALTELNLRRFRLMSYWNIHESEPGRYNFDELDWQLDMLAEHGATASLCLGKRQPRWPECHMPEWASQLPKAEWYAALFAYIEVVVRRYKDHPALSSWQLENEALLKTFGHCPDQDYSHTRLRHEFELVKRLDPKHPVVMTLSDSWGLPWHQPKPDAYAMSLYRQNFNKGRYNYSTRPSAFYRARAALTQLLKRRPVFIHELQAEPWPHMPITEMPLEEQLKLMNPERLKENMVFGLSTALRPLDLWGLEWWYWLRQEHDYHALWLTVHDNIT